MPTTRADFGVGQDVQSNPKAAYFACVTDPKKQIARIPDVFGDKSSVFRSIQVIDLNLTFTGSPNDGKFSVVTKPTLGATDNVNHFSTALVNPQIVWPVGDFQNPNNYSSTLASNDIRIDPFYDIMTQPSTGFFYNQVPFGGAGVGMPAPFGNMGEFNNDLLAYNSTNANVYPYYDLSVAGTSTFSLAIGTYTITLQTATGGPFIVTPFGANIITNLRTVTSGGFGNPSMTTFVLTVVPNQASAFSVTLSAAPTAGVQSVQIVPLYTPSLPSYADGGIINTIRPVGMMLLFTYQNSDLNNAGRIASAFVPGNTCRNDFFSPNPNNAVGGLYEYDNLARIQGAYDGPLKKGSYVWWSPKTIEDIQFRTPDQMVRYDYPCLITSGTYAPALQGAPAYPYTINCGRIEIVRVFEFQTNIVLFESKTLLGSSADFEEMMRLFNMLGHTGQNDEHMKFVKDALAWAKQAIRDTGEFLWENRSALMAAGGALATLL